MRTHASDLFDRALLPLTWPASLLYGLVIGIRNRLYNARLEVRRLPAPVVSVGNLTVGGSGKTPLVAWMARRYLERGWPVAVLSRGYRRRGSREGREGAPFVLVSDGRQLLADIDVAGDEPLELARSVKGLVVAVGANRYRTGLEVIRRWGTHLFILDDGFQHRRLFRNLDLVCLDAGERTQDLNLLPKGRLREPLSSLSRAHALVWTRARAGRPNSELSSRVLRAIRKDLPVFRGGSRLAGLARLAGSGEVLPPEALRDTAVGLMAGMARPDRLEEDLREVGARVTWLACRRDHHRWSRQEVERLTDGAREKGIQAIVVTGKDSVKLDFLESTPVPVYRAELETRIEESERFDRMVEAIPGWTGPSTRPRDRG